MRGHDHQHGVMDMSSLNRKRTHHQALPDNVSLRLILNQSTKFFHGVVGSTDESRPWQRVSARSSAGVHDTITDYSFRSSARTRTRAHLTAGRGVFARDWIVPRPLRHLSEDQVSARSAAAPICAVQCLRARVRACWHACMRACARECVFVCVYARVRSVVCSVFCLVCCAWSHPCCTSLRVHEGGAAVIL